MDINKGLPPMIGSSKAHRESLNELVLINRRTLGFEKQFILNMQRQKTLSELALKIFERTRNPFPMFQLVGISKPEVKAIHPELFFTKEELRTGIVAEDRFPFDT